MKAWNIFFIFLVSLVLSVEVSSTTRYRHFEDYLSNLEVEDQENQLELGIPQTTTTDQPPSPKGTKKDKEVNCCMLGQLAGDKGFHCFVNFYIARLWRRNYNRAHNRKMAFHGSGRIPNYGQKTMRTFQQCVAGFGVIFHKCCHLATIEKRIVRYNSNHLRRNVHLHRYSENRLNRKADYTT
ncbi:uncharacterized protein LOC106468605 [Limulus polyphemus]|uniref:Uncharacterized protein LOC106468605 n=1 Tax=Limulus polyphemus TaxID=6850 RepID=A0ABM1BLM3_LIMPO|nr:uncharacterized protein LOC106468605 [Limulus polyphemus]